MTTPIPDLWSIGSVDKRDVGRWTARAGRRLIDRSKGRKTGRDWAIKAEYVAPGEAKEWDRYELGFRPIEMENE